MGNPMGKISRWRWNRPLRSTKHSLMMGRQTSPCCWWIPHVHLLLHRIIGVNSVFRIQDMATFESCKLSHVRCYLAIGTSSSTEMILPWNLIKHGPGFLWMSLYDMKSYRWVSQIPSGFPVLLVALSRRIPPSLAKFVLSHGEIPPFFWADELSLFFKVAWGWIMLTFREVWETFLVVLRPSHCDLELTP